MFVEKYIQMQMNGTKAYKAVYGEGLDDDVAGANAARLLGNARVKEYLEERFQQEVMSSDEVLHRIAQHARADIGDFMDIESMSFDIDLAKAKKNNLTHLIKKVRVTTKIDAKNEEETHVLDLELVDTQAALRDLGKAFRLFVDVSENTTNLNIQGVDKMLDAVYGDSDDDDQGE